MHNEVAHAKYAKDLIIDKNDLDRELMEQADSFFKCAEQYALAVSEAAAAKDNVKKVMGKAYKNFSKRTNSNGKPLTQDMIKAMVDSCKDVRLARKKWHEKILSEGRWGALKDAWAQRSFLLKDLVQMHIKTYLTDDSVSAPRRDFGDDSGRKNLAAARKKRGKK